MNELNRRKAVCYTHPFRGGMINMLPDGRALGITLSTETTLTIQSILYTNTATRCPDIRFIWSHGGGTAPYITRRLGAAVGPDGKPNANLAALQKFYYDTAQAFNPYTLATFTRIVPAWNRPSSRCPATYRTGAPTAAPSATSAQVTGHPPRGRTRCARRGC